MCVEPESTKHFISVDFSGCLGFESFTTVCTNPIILIYTKIPSSSGIVNENVLRFSQLKKPYTGCWILLHKICIMASPPISCDHSKFATCSPMARGIRYSRNVYRWAIKIERRAIYNGSHFLGINKSGRKVSMLNNPSAHLITNQANNVASCMRRSLQLKWERKTRQIPNGAYLRKDDNL